MLPADSPFLSFNRISVKVVQVASFGKKNLAESVAISHFSRNLTGGIKSMKTQQSKRIRNAKVYRKALARFLKTERKNRMILCRPFRSQRLEKLYRRKWRARLRSWKAPESWPCATVKPAVGIKRSWKKYEKLQGSKLQGQLQSVFHDLVFKEPVQKPTRRQKACSNAGQPAACIRRVGDERKTTTVRDKLPVLHFGRK